MGEEDVGVGGDIAVLVAESFDDEFSLDVDAVFLEVLDEAISEEGAGSFDGDGKGISGFAGADEGDFVGAEATGRAGFIFRAGGAFVGEVDVGGVGHEGVGSEFAWGGRGDGDVEAVVVEV